MKHWRPHRIRCSKCGRLQPELRIHDHEERCGKAGSQQGHVLCGCGNLMSRGALCCFRCSGTAAELDRLVMAGRDIARNRTNKTARLW